MLTVNPIEVLTRAKQLLEHGWIAGHEAVYTSEDGSILSCKPWSEKAEKWCVLGSVRAATYMLDPENEPFNTKYIMSAISIANPGILSANISNGAISDSWGYVQHTNDHTNQQRAIQMVTKGLIHLTKHPPKIAQSTAAIERVSNDFSSEYKGNPKYDRN